MFFYISITPPVYPFIYLSIYLNIYITIYEVPSFAECSGLIVNGARKNKRKMFLHYYRRENYSIWTVCLCNKEKIWNSIHTYLHFVLRFWNQVLTWASVIFKFLAKDALSAEAKYFCLWNLFSNSAICSLVNDVRGFFRFGGVLFWYGCPIRLVIGNAAEKNRILVSWNENNWHVTTLF